jgi:hypothetical protein
MKVQGAYQQKQATGANSPLHFCLLAVTAPTAGLSVGSAATGVVFPGANSDGT